ncbi:MAG: RICIN domain-containing protein [Dysgonamonadaceae bacterium]|jgi:hypothetical protein|nr:RICIN domain-containing protein [Dysgonamonadaceae bacterium]
MKQLILTIIICAFAVAKAEAQFETSTATAPKWYFIQVKGIGDNAGKVVTEVNGQAVGMPAETGLAAKARQLWRIEAVSNGSSIQYEIVNKHSGNKLDVRYDEKLNLRIAVTTSETPSTQWRIPVYSGNYYHLRIATPPQSGSGTYLTQGGASLDSILYFTTSNASSDAQFQFISTDAPTISEGDETAWFSIHNAQSSLREKCLTEVPLAPDETPAGIHLSMQDFTEDNPLQQWKIKSITGGTVNFVNRQTGHLISTEPLRGIYDYVRYATGETTGWTIDKLEDNQYEVRTGAAGIEKYWYAATDGEASAYYLKGASLNTGFAWKFLLRDEEIHTAINAPEQDNTRIFVRNRRIYVEGADQYRIYTIYGTRIDGNHELPTGIYLVTINKKTTKVLVK